MSYRTTDEKIIDIIRMFQDLARHHESSARSAKSPRIIHFHKVRARTMREAARTVQAYFPNVVA